MKLDKTLDNLIENYDNWHPVDDWNEFDNKFQVTNKTIQFAKDTSV